MKKALIICFTIVALYNSVAQSLCMNNAYNFTVQAYSHLDIRSADLNNDGNNDLITLGTWGAPSVMVVNLGIGNGSFGSSANYTVGTNLCYELINADFNNDFKTDVAIARASTNDFAVMLGNGAGGFGGITSFPVGSNPYSITSADFNNDGKLDIATANQGSNNFSIRLGNGAGSFSAAINYSMGTNPTSIVSADFNNDGKVDVATANYTSNNISIRLGNGMGGFGAVTNYTVSNTPRKLIKSDFNNDGKLDLAISPFPSSNFFSVLLGNGSGGFGAPTTFTTAGCLYSLVSADFNSDGKMDIAGANWNCLSTYSVSVFLGLGTGNFNSAVNYSVTAPYPGAITAGYLNGDSKIDLATGSSTLSNVSVLLNCNTTDIQNTVMDSKFKVYPNPSNGLFVLEGLNIESTVEVMDYTGRVIYIEKNVNTNHIIDLKEKQEGIYFFRITDKEKNLIQGKLLYEK